VDIQGLDEAAILLSLRTVALLLFPLPLQGSALCVDIQGVGDLYTDPQIHTLDGQGYGDGNLALRGEALVWDTVSVTFLP
jgi:hypothetical protein